MLNYTRNFLKRSNTHSKTKSNTLEKAARYRHLNRHSLGHCEEPFDGSWVSPIPPIQSGAGSREREVREPQRSIRLLYSNEFNITSYNIPGWNKSKLRSKL